MQRIADLSLQIREDDKLDLDQCYVTGEVHCTTAGISIEVSMI